MNCPICKARNVTAAHILGHGGKGVSKTITKADRLGRSERMKALNAKRRAESQNEKLTDGGPVSTDFNETQSRHSVQRSKELATASLEQNHKHKQTK